MVIIAICRRRINQNVHHEYITHNIKYLLEHHETVNTKDGEKIKEKGPGKNRMEENIYNVRLKWTGK